MKKEDNKKGNEKHTLAGDAGHKQGHSVSEATNVCRYRISGLVSQEKITKNPKINSTKNHTFEHNCFFSPCGVIIECSKRCVK
jgi:hypothetical protein